jgi:hypothetical protein
MMDLDRSSMQYVKLILLVLIAILSSHAILGEGAQEGVRGEGRVDPGYQE